MITMREAIFAFSADVSCLHFHLYHLTRATLSLVACGRLNGVDASSRLEVRGAQNELLEQTDISTEGRRFGHGDAVFHLMNWFYSNYGESMLISGVGHRVPHGGEVFAEPALVDPGVLEELERLVFLSPVIQPLALAGIKAIARFFPDLPQVACFDTAFYRGRPSSSNT